MSYKLCAACILTIVVFAKGAEPPFDDNRANLPRDSRLSSNASEQFFKSPNVSRLTIETTDEELQELKKDSRKYVRATVREGDVIYHDVGIHLKGAAGSFRELGDRPSLTLNFDKFTDGRNFHGLDKIHLNNSVQDPSYLTDILCAEMFLAAGVPATRGAHARVELNGRDLGLYVLKEGFDKTFLRRHFKNVSGNLYESGFMNDITEQLHKNSGDGDVFGLR
jgi:spore coat protein H